MCSSDRSAMSLHTCRSSWGCMCGSTAAHRPHTPTASSSPCSTRPPLQHSTGQPRLQRSPACSWRWLAAGKRPHMSCSWRSCQCHNWRQSRRCSLSTQSSRRAVGHEERVSTTEGRQSPDSRCRIAGCPARSRRRQGSSSMHSQCCRCGCGCCTLSHSLSRTSLEREQEREQRFK